jgi:hypothetical protein
MAGALVTTNVLSTLCAMGLATLRERLALVLIANREYERMITGATRFATVNVAVPATVAVRAVAPDVVPPAVSALTPTSIPVTLTEWYEAPFAMDDKGLIQVDNGILPMQAKEAVKAVANNIEDYLWSLLAANISQYAGTAGVTPFGTGLDEFLAADKNLNDSLADPEDRFMVIGTAAKASAMGLRAIQDASFRGGKSNSLISGEIGDILGARWLMSQRVPRHTSGTYSTGAGGTTVTTVEPVGETVIALSGGATGTILAGDIVDFGVTNANGQLETYNVVSSVGGSTPSSITIAAPGLKTATAGGEALTTRASHAQNILIQKNCLTFAMAPLMDTVKVPGATMQSVAIDEKSGLSLRLEVSRQHRQVQWAFDALYGGKVIRPQFASWVAGQ